MIRSKQTEKIKAWWLPFTSYNNCNYSTDGVWQTNTAKPHQSPWPRGLATLLKCTRELSIPLSILFNKLLESSVGHSVDVLCFDFAKANSVPHNHLICKLHSCGISGSLLEWVRNFLVGKEQKVVLNNYELEWSVLGPILFMPLIFNRPIVQFADDLKMFKIIASVNDYLQFKHDINLLYEWSKNGS